MKKSLKQKALILAVICGLTLTTVNCGIILYPERKGQKSGELDVPVMVMDCLWLIAGVVPGVVALVVDYSTGGMYQPSSPVKSKPGKKALIASQRTGAGRCHNRDQVKLQRRIILHFAYAEVCQRRDQAYPGIGLHHSRKP